MKLKINKACDLSSISVLPPQSRRSSMVPPQQQRSQPSQQSFSQGGSSQHNGMFSQISQTSLADVNTENQRYGSQDYDNSVKRVSCRAPIPYPREESQMPNSRSSTSLTRRWSVASLPDHKCQLSDVLEHKIAMVEASLSRFDKILDSIQTDIMQVNKGTKELKLEVEAIHQKSSVHDDILHLLSRGQEDTRVDLKLINDQLGKITQQDRSQEILSAVFSLPEHIDRNVQKLNHELSRDLQAISCSLNSLNQKDKALAILPPKVTGADSSSEKSFHKREAELAKVSKKSPLAPKIEMGCWTIVKAEQVRNSSKNLKQRRTSLRDQEQKFVIELDEETDEDLCCFIVEKEIDSHLMDEVKEETERILREARKRKRRQSFRRSMQS